jgi:IPT/TIG domain-containing protein
LFDEDIAGRPKPEMRAVAVNLLPPNPAPRAAFRRTYLTHKKLNRSTIPAISQEAAMRSASLLLIIALTAGCGASGHDPKATFGNRFNPPALTTLDPSTVPENSTPFVLTVNGNNFTTDAMVFWNRVPHTARFVSPTQLQVPITTDDLTTFGLVPVYVQTAGMTSNTVTFNVTAQ